MSAAATTRVERQQQQNRDEMTAQRVEERRRKLQSWAWRIAGYAVLLGAWTLGSGRLMPAYLLPTPWTVLQYIWDLLLNGQIFTHFGASLTKISIGFVISFLIGGTIGILMRRPFWDRFFRDSVVGTISTPGLVFALTAAMIFGISFWGPIFAIVVTSFPFVTINVHEGVRAIPKELLDMAKAYEVPERDRIRHVVIPHLAPYSFTAARYSFAITWKITMLTELFGSVNGIGFMMRTAFQEFSMTGVLAWVGSFFLFALFIEKVVLERIETRFFRWRQVAVTT